MTGIRDRAFARVGSWLFRNAWKGGFPGVHPLHGWAGWTEVRVVGEPEAQDALLAEGLAPFLRDRTGPAPRAFFLRERIDDSLRLRIWISHAAESEALAEALRGVAKKSGISVPLRVLPGPSRDTAPGPYSGRQSTPLLTRFLAEACPLLLDQVSALAAGRTSRLAVALDIMVAHLPAIDIARVFPGRYPFAPVREPGFPSAFPVYRSHADGFLVMSTDPAGARSRLDAQYGRAAALIRPRVTAVLSQFADGPVLSEVGLRWHELARRHLLRAEEAIRAGTLRVRWHGGYIGDSYDLSASPFHQIVQNEPALRAFLRRDPGYLAARFTMSALYLALSSVGIRLADRYFLCHAISRACEELFGLEATAVLLSLARSVPRGRAVRIGPGA